MHVRATNALSDQNYLLKLVEVQQIAKEQENFPQGSLLSKGDLRMETTFDVYAEQLKDGKSQLTVRAVTNGSKKRFRINEIHLD